MSLSRGSPQIPGCWRRQTNPQITRYRPRSYGGLSFLSLAAQTAKKSASLNRIYEVAAAWRRCFFCIFWKWRRRMTKPKANKPNTRAYSSGSGMVALWKRKVTPLPAKFGFRFAQLFTFPVTKSLTGLFINKPDPVQEDACPL